MFGSRDGTERPAHDEARVQPVAANLLDRQFGAAQPNQRWVGDTTELVVGSSAKLYLAAILDLVMLAHRGRPEALAARAWSPSSRINRPTRFSLTRSPASRRSFHTRGRP